jgi:hypothetical protein
MWMNKKRGRKNNVKMEGVRNIALKECRKGGGWKRTVVDEEEKLGK